MLVVGRYVRGRSCDVIEGEPASPFSVRQHNPVNVYIVQLILADVSLKVFERGVERLEGNHTPLTVGGEGQRVKPYVCAQIINDAIVRDIRGKQRSRVLFPLESVSVKEHQMLFDAGLHDQAILHFKITLYVWNELANEGRPERVWLPVCGLYNSAHFISSNQRVTNPRQ